MHKEKIKGILIVFACLLCVCAVLVGVAGSIPVIANMSVMGVHENIREDFGGQNYDCILVLGAGLRSDGSPSDMLADRLDVAIELYRKGVSEVIILSGDRSGEDYDEVSSMVRYCLAAGIPAEAIVEDGRGYSTYESVYNTKSDGSYKKILVVTQRYHLYRAMYIADKMGLDADGADAALRSYRGQLFREIREVAARTKDFFMVMLYEE